MSRQFLAIANCRVSSDEQLLNNSLVRQQMSVEAAAERLETNIIRTWSGSVSSKAGENVNRKDLLEMLEFCKKNKGVKYAIFDEYDRFMRSSLEGPYFEVLFQQQGVKVWFASETDEFNGDDATAKLLRSLSAFKAEGSNEERQKKSIAGQTVALKEGRYPFVPKPGYNRGHQRGVPEIDAIRGPLLKQAMCRIIERKVTPTQALIDLNKTDFVKGRALYKMDKFRKILTDPFYAGVVEINKQVNFRNENGLHDRLITMDQHLELVKIMNGKPKNQAGPRKNGNPKYPLNNLVTHDPCSDERYGRIVGVDIHNGKNRTRIYSKYRCRTCKQSVPRDELHAKIEEHFKRTRLTDEGLNNLLEALEHVWKQKEGEKAQETSRLRFKIKDLSRSIAQQVEAATNPENAFIKPEILSAIAKKKEEVSGLEDELGRLQSQADENKERFLRFTFDFIDNMGARFLDPTLSDDNRKRCKQIVFPAGFRMDADKNVYTPEISPLYRLATNIKDLPETEKSSMVRVTGL